MRTGFKDSAVDGLSLGMKRTVALTLIVIFMNGWAKASQRENPTKSSAEQEIRAALCDLEKRDFANAQKKIEAVLKSDPENIYAQKVSLGIVAEQIKPGDTSAENIALIGKAVETYSQAMKNPRFSAEEKTNIDRYVMILYRQLGEEELKKELQRRALDPDRKPKERADAYAALAAKSWDCAYRITSTKRALQKSEIENVEKCVAFGGEYADAAIRLDAENENAWSFKALLLSETAKLYGLKNDQALKATAQRLSDEAQKRATQLANVRREAEEKEWARQDEERKKNDSFTSADADKAAKELTEYRAETSLDEAVKAIFFPQNLEVTSLVAPVPIPQEKTEQKPQETTASISRPPEKGCFREVDGSRRCRKSASGKVFLPMKTSSSIYRTMYALVEEVTPRPAKV